MVDSLLSPLYCECHRQESAQTTLCYTTRLPLYDRCHRQESARTTLCYTTRLPLYDRCHRRESAQTTLCYTTRLPLYCRCHKQKSVPAHSLGHIELQRCSLCKAHITHCHAPYSRSLAEPPET